MERGSAYKRLGDHVRSRHGDPTTFFKRAVNDFTQALELNSGRGITWRHLAGTRDKWGHYLMHVGKEDAEEQFLKAIEAAGRAISINPKYGIALWVRADARRHLGIYRQGQNKSAIPNYEAAIRDYHEAMRVDPRFKSQMDKKITACHELIESAAKKP